MRRFYQESWQGIPFTTFAHLSFFHLADSKFYSTFYEELFRRYKSWDDLPAIWRSNKEKDAQWLADKIAKIERNDADRPFRVLSIGSGVGFMEQALLKASPHIELHLNEPSTVGMRWMRKLIPTERIYIGLPTFSIPADITFDFIYLSAVDYGIPQREFARLLEFLQTQLTGEGELVCISASLLEEFSLVGAMVNGMKNLIRAFLHYMYIRRQQFWGWRRTREEYRRLFNRAGFASIQDGILDDGFDSYWISGKNKSAND